MNYALTHLDVVKIGIKGRALFQYLKAGGTPINELDSFVILD